MTLVHEPGTIRRVHYHQGRTDNGKYPVSYWGDVESQIVEATEANTLRTSRMLHRTMPLYRMSDDCGHANPEEDDRYRDVEDLVDEWMRRNTPGLTWRDGDLYWKNRRRGEASVPLYVEWDDAQAAYQDVHVGNVCLDTPTGSCCEACTQGDDDFGYEPGECLLPTELREDYDLFWWRVSPEGVADRERQKEDR